MKTVDSEGMRGTKGPVKAFYSLGSYLADM